MLQTTKIIGLLALSLMSTNSNATQTEINSENLITKEYLISTEWGSNSLMMHGWGKSIEFYEDGTFLETFFAEGNDPHNRGTYTINNNKIYLDVQTYLNMSEEEYRKIWGDDILLMQDQVLELKTDPDSIIYSKYLQSSSNSRSYYTKYYDQNSRIAADQGIEYKDINLISPSHKYIDSKAKEDALFKKEPEVNSSTYTFYSEKDCGRNNSNDFECPNSEIVIGVIGRTEDTKEYKQNNDYWYLVEIQPPIYDSVIKLKNERVYPTYAWLHGSEIQTK